MERSQRCAAHNNALVMFRWGVYLQLISVVIGCAGRASTQPKMWEFEVQMRDSGMSCVFAGYSSKKQDGW